eukprot:jgi/Ulvmu1/11524/UM078_0013.1
MATWVVENVCFSWMVAFLLSVIARTAQEAGFGNATTTGYGVFAETWSACSEGARGRIVINVQDDRLGQAFYQAIHGRSLPNTTQAQTVRRASPLDKNAIIELVGARATQDQIISHFSQYGTIARIDDILVPPNHIWTTKQISKASWPFLTTPHSVRLTRVILARAEDAAKILEAKSDVSLEFGTSVALCDSCLPGPQIILRGGRELAQAHLPELLDAAPEIVSQRVFYDPTQKVYNRALHFVTLGAASQFLHKQQLRAAMYGSSFYTFFFNERLTAWWGSDNWVTVWDMDAHNSLVLPAQVGNAAATIKTAQETVLKASAGRAVCTSVMQPLMNGEVQMRFQSSVQMAEALKALRASGGLFAGAKPLDAFAWQPKAAATLPPPPPPVRTESKGGASARSAATGAGGKVGWTSPGSAASTNIAAFFQASLVKSVVA